MNWNLFSFARGFDDYAINLDKSIGSRFSQLTQNIGHFTQLTDTATPFSKVIELSYSGTKYSDVFEWVKAEMMDAVRKGTPSIVKIFNKEITILEAEDLVAFDCHKYGKIYTVECFTAHRVFTVGRFNTERAAKDFLHFLVIELRRGHSVLIDGDNYENIV